jgi:hypothetical protein
LKNFLVVTRGMKVVTRYRESKPSGVTSFDLTA